MSHNVPQPFRGSTLEDARTWFSSMEWYIETQRPANDMAKIALIAVNLREAALSWLQSLNIGQTGSLTDINTFAQFKEIFLNKFKIPNNSRWRVISELYTMKQGVCESTEGFINEVRIKGKAAHASDEQVRYAALAGLRDEVRLQVLHHDIESLDDIIRWGSLTEAAGPSASDKVSMELLRLRELVETRLNHLESKSSSN